jgi:hypothetical protein
MLSASLIRTEHAVPASAYNHCGSYNFRIRHSDQWRRSSAIFELENTVTSVLLAILRTGSRNMPDITLLSLYTNRAYA